jgi:hypothetical protein
MTMSSHTLMIMASNFFRHLPLIPNRSVIGKIPQGAEANYHRHSDNEKFNDENRGNHINVFCAHEQPVILFRAHSVSHRVNLITNTPQQSTN